MPPYSHHFQGFRRWGTWAEGERSCRYLRIPVGPSTCRCWGVRCQYRFDRMRFSSESFIGTVTANLQSASTSMYCVWMKCVTRRHPHRVGCEELSCREIWNNCSKYLFRPKLECASVWSHQWGLFSVGKSSCCRHIRELPGVYRVSSVLVMSAMSPFWVFLENHLASGSISVQVNRGGKIILFVVLTWSRTMVISLLWKCRLTS